ncbi:MAG: hypothetical protein JNM70_23845 [Anaerolineae bacterium]|nr:hypothetical protein [Anaerolineae bacterium]
MDDLDDISPTLAISDTDTDDISDNSFLWLSAKSERLSAFSINYKLPTILPSLTQTGVSNPDGTAAIAAISAKLFR